MQPDYIADNAIMIVNLAVHHLINDDLNSSASMDCDRNSLCLEALSASNPKMIVNLG